MAGLLDFYNDPSQQGLLGLTAALLEAGGPSRMPIGLGQALGRGLLQGGQMQQSATQNQLAQTYLGEQVKQLQATNNKTALMSPILAGIAQRLGGGGQQLPQPQEVPAGLSTASAVALNAPWAARTGTGGIPNLAQQGGGSGGAAFPVSLEDITLLKLIGGPDLTSAYTASRPNVEVKDGVMYDKHSGQITNTIPTVNQQGFATQLVPDGKGGWSIGMVPGAREAYGTQQRIGAQAQADFDPFLGALDPAGRPIPQTRGQFVAGVTGGRGSQPQGMGPTPAARQAATTAATGDANKVLELEGKIPSLLSVNRRLDRMASLTQDDNTYAAAGAEVKSMLGSIAQSFGLNVSQGKTANTEEYLAHVAELLKDRLASKDFGSGSGVSNLDIIAAQKPLPELAKTAQGRLQLITALKADTQRNLTDAQAARDYFDANQGLRGFRYPSELDAERAKKTDDLKNISAGGAQPRPNAIPQGVTVKRIK